MLGDLAFDRLQDALTDFNLHPQTVKNVVDLIAYTFGAFSESAMDHKMCKMLVHYAGCIFEDLVKCNGFGRLTSECPIFVHELMIMMTRRLE